MSKRTFKDEHPLGECSQCIASKKWSLLLHLPTSALPLIDWVLPACTYRALSIVAEKRQAEAARIRDKYPDRIPVGNMQPLRCSKAC